jgi:hypothetical protein
MVRPLGSACGPTWVYLGSGLLAIVEGGEGGEEREMELAGS